MPSLDAVHPFWTLFLLVSEISTEGGLAVCGLFPVENRISVYSYARHSLEDGYSVSYLTTISNSDLVEKLEKHWPGFASYIDSRYLSIRAAQNYFPRKELPAASSEVKSQKKSAKNSIILICPDAISTYVRLRQASSKAKSTTSAVENILQFEDSLCRQFFSSIVVCGVFNELIQSFDAISLIRFMTYHGFVIARNGKIVALTSDMIIAAMRRVIDLILGDHSSTLIFKSLKIIHNLDEDIILENPERFSEKLKKLLGERTSKQILDAAAEEMRRLLS